jgi:drug/metabolite transporter (DMT)-like permease
MEPTSDEQRAAPTLSWVWRLAALTLIWGSSFLLIKVALEGFAPLQVAFWRISTGAATLLVIAALSGLRLPTDRRIWLHAAGIGLVSNAIPFTLFAWGETRLGSVEAGIWNATTPLMVLLVLLVVPGGERLTGWAAAGLGIGFAGVLVVLAPWAGLSGGELSGHLAFAGAAACYGVATPWIRHAFGNRAESAVQLSAIQVTCASGWMLLATAPKVGLLPDSTPPLDAVASVVALGALGTALAYILFTTLIRQVGSATAASVTYLMPIVSTTLGVFVLGELIGWHEPVGAVVILLGVATTAWGASRARARTAEAGQVRPVAS